MLGVTGATEEGGGVGRMEERGGRRGEVEEEEEEEERAERREREAETRDGIAEDV